MTAPDTPDPRQSQGTLTLKAVTAPFSLGNWLGRNGRGIFGGIIILIDAGLLGYDTIIVHEAVTMPDVILHLGMFLGGLALIDREKVADILVAAKGLLPGGGGGI